MSKLFGCPDLKVLITVFNSCTPITKSSHFKSILLPIDPSVLSFGFVFVTTPSVVEDETESPESSLMFAASVIESLRSS